jgi:hypothetical protein
MVGEIADTSDIVIGETIDAADVKPPIDQLNDWLVALKTKSYFSVHKNGTGQTIAASSVQVKVTWSTEEADVAGDFDLANERFLPLTRGIYRLSFAVDFGDFIDVKLIGATIYKNGVAYKEFQNWSSGGSFRQGVHGGLDVEANGTTDYFELYISQSDTVTHQLAGAASRTWFIGSFVRWT